MSTPEVARWAEKVDQADGYLIVTAEYNHGYPALLKNALDQVHPELFSSLDERLERAVTDLVWWAEALATARHATAAASA